MCNRTGKILQDQKFETCPMPIYGNTFKVKNVTNVFFSEESKIVCHKN